MEVNKVSLNAWIDEAAVMRWRKFAEGLRGNQGDRFAAALLSLQALSAIDPEIPALLMRRTLSVKEATTLIRQRVLAAAEEVARQELRDLPPEVLAPLLERAARSLCADSDQDSCI